LCIVAKLYVTVMIRDVSVFAQAAIPGDS